MSYKTYRMIQGINGAVLGAIMAISVIIGNWIIPIIAVILSVMLLMVLRRRVKDIIVDERTYAISEKASRLTLQIVAIGMAVTGVFLLAFNHGEDKTLTHVALTLEYATCALLVISYIAYYYYRNKLGGKNE
jgi:uncharacterized membrane protein